MEKMNAMVELNLEDLGNVSGGGPRIREILIKIRKAVMANPTLKKLYEQLDDGDRSDNSLLEEIVWEYCSCPMRFDYANDNIIFEWPLDQVLSIIRHR